MKTISFFCLALMLALNTLSGQTSTATAATELTTPIAWDKTVYAFGDIPQNKPVTAAFVLTNNGDQPLLITNVKSTCGCTVPKYQEAPILPGEQTTIKANFNAKKAGVFTKTIRVFTSVSDQPIPLTLKGKVVVPEAD